ncbi:unnamed protein product [Malus baccata var. baccata]
MAMHLGSLLLCVVLLTGFSLTNSKAVTTYPPVHCDILNRSSFEPGFTFGTASSAYQVEGAWKEGGRGPSIWDTFTHNHPEKIMDGSNGDVAIDQYHRYKEDVRIMKDMGMDAYRFSISWSRVLPNGTLSGGVNTKGIEYYNNLIDELLDNGLKPFVTIFHWDVPQTLEDEYGAERNNKSIGLQAGSDWLYVYPQGIHDLVVYTMKKYNDPFIYITENGIDEVNDPNLPLEEALNDIARIDYYREHLCYLQAAIKKGVKVKGYFAWSVLDNFEWNDGYTVRFGIKFVDYDHGLRRYSKKSTYWFKRFLNKAGRNLNIVDSNVVDTKFVNGVKVKEYSRQL